MSYDVQLTLDAGGEYPVEIWSQNHTSNTAGMWRAVGCDLAEWEGDEARTHTEELTKGIEELNKNPQPYRRFEPDNHWGTIQSTIQFLEAIRDATIEYPKAKFHIFR